ncbi:E3 ubiquitin-protein ligase Rnf220 like protein [Argiope bruennichi]|uniref:E3 ubiquitin-protein ligase Rnf220 like protein n=1 Tax=Argiope bruennichi TaxID=94029 RepID=A0A8T0FXX1_ARGBR|nr:E3 ubiquitin-protein ligase Rnf220 like protein [Argiope bruennichi]
MSSHNDRLRGRAGFFPSGLKFPPFQGLCLDSSAYLSNAMGGPLMVLSSTCGDVTPHAQSHNNIVKINNIQIEVTTIQVENTGFKFYEYFQGHKKYFLDGQTPYCPVCGVSLQLSELSSHFDLEVERLMEMNKCPSSHMEISSMHSPFSSPLCMVRKDEKGKPESRWETYQRVKGNRTTRLTSRCVLKRKKWDDPNERAQEEAVHLLPPGLRKREHPEMDAEGAIDSRTAANFNWAVTARLHAFANLQRSLPDFSARKFEVPEDENQELNVDGDDSATYGQPHYTEADVITCSTEDNADNKEQIRRLQTNDSSYQRISDSSQWNVNGGNNAEGQEVTSTCVSNNDASSECVSPSEKGSKPNKEANGDNPKDQIEDGIKCLICMEPFIKPVVSICCWHVHCEECWLKTLGTKKLCPQCNMITSARDLRRIYL